MIPETIELANLFMGLSLAIDLAEGRRLQHAHNVTYVACRLGEELGLPESAMNSLFFTGLLHGIATISDKNLCPVCAAIEDFEEDGVAEALHDTDQAIHLSQEYWDGRGPRGLTGKSIPLLSRILALSIGLEENNAATARREYYLWQETARDYLVKNQGIYYDPELVSVFLGILRDRRFSLNLSNPNSSEKLAPYRPKARISGRGKTMTLLGKAFASVIDQKSSYTANHSRDVAEVSKQLAAKLAISNEILDKQGPLTDKEFAIVKNHPHYTAVILDRIPELKRLGEIASLHHEKISGDGYYLGIAGQDIPFASRIIAVADIYSALAVDRPYRRALDARTIKEVMFGMLKDNHLDGSVVDALFSTVG